MKNWMAYSTAQHSMETILLQLDNYSMAAFGKCKTLDIVGFHASTVEIG